MVVGREGAERRGDRSVGPMENLTRRETKKRVATKTYSSEMDTGWYPKTIEMKGTAR